MKEKNLFWRGIFLGIIGSFLGGIFSGLILPLIDIEFRFIIALFAGLFFILSLIIIIKQIK